MKISSMQEQFPADIEAAARESSEQKYPLVLLIIFFVAISLRVANILQFRANDPMFHNSPPMLDMFQFQKWMFNILDTNWLDRENTPFWQAPLYAYAMALVMKVFGRDLLWVKLFQALLGSLNCVLVYVIGRKVFNAKVGLVAALLACFYGMFLFYEAVLLREIFLTSVYLLSMLSLLLAREKGGYLRYLAAGACLGLNIIGRENLLLFIPAAIGWIWIYGGQPSRRKAGLSILAVLLGVSLAVAPVTMKNYFQGGELVLISKGGGFNFYMGNCRDADGTLSITPSMLKIAPNLFYLSTTELPRIDWFGFAVKEITADPGHFAGLLFRKLYLYWEGYEIPDNVNYYLGKRFSWVLRLPLLSCWFILPFAVTGIILSIKEWPKPALLLLFLLTYMISILLIYVVARYRVPMIPYLLIFAGYTFVWWREKIRVRQFRKIALSMFPFVAAGIFSLATRSDYIRPNDYFNVALAYQMKGQYRKAAADYEKALRVDPAFSAARKNLVLCYLSLDQSEEALASAMEGTRVEPENAERFYDLALVLNEDGRIEKAIANFEHALVLDPSHIAARKWLVSLYERQGRSGAAWAERQKIMESAPAN